MHIETLAGGGGGELQALSMAAQGSASENLSISLSQKVKNIISGSMQDYSSWTSLISEIDTASPADAADMDIISLAYDSFLSRFPLCHWHLEKYAYQKAKFCNSQEAANIFEQAVEVAMYSVGFWAEYFTFAATCFGSPVDIRRLFERAISFVGKDYCCHVLWDKYMKYEFSQEGWIFLAQSYIWSLRFPTKKLHFYYDNFKQFVENLEEEIGYDKSDNIVGQISAPCAALELSKDEISLVIKDMLNSSDRPLKSKALNRYRSIGEEFYLEARRMDEKIRCFETNIQRRYFDVTPLDDDQLTNWHLYLDFIEKQGNLDWTTKLYERCLIPCANYPEFWMRYVEFLESEGGRELALSALARATQIFLKSVPEVHLFDARFKEHIGDADGARAALALCDPKTDSTFIESIDAQANLERRLGNLAATSATYEKAIKKAREKQKLHLLPTLYSHFARLKFLITGRAAASRDVLIEGIQQVPHCRFLLEELINFAMTHEGASHVNIIKSIIADAISPRLDKNEGLDAKDRENISRLFLEFVNLCGTMHDIREAWNCHVKLFPQSLRKKMSSKHPASGSYPISLVRDKKGKYGQEQVPQFPLSNGVHPNEVARRPSPSPLMEKVQLLSTKEVLPNGDESRDSEPAYGIPLHSRENEQMPMVVSGEISDHAKENALTGRDSNQSRRDELGPMNVTAELGTLSPPMSAHDVGKSMGTTESIEASHSSLPNLQPELDSVSLDRNSSKSPEKEMQELIPMSCDEHGDMRNVSLASHSAESLKVSSESERDGSVSQNHNASMEVSNPEEPSRSHEVSIEMDNVVPAPGHAASRFQDKMLNIEQSPYIKHHPADAVNSKRVMNQGGSQQYPARQQHSQSEEKATDLDQQRREPAFYAEQNTNPTTSQQEWQAQQMNQMMLQYHYQQYQYQYQQQQLQMQQHPYYHYMNQQQPYQQPNQQQPYQQHNQQQPYQQQNQQQHIQMQQGHESNPNSEQPPEVAYQVHQLAYQQQATTPEQQQLLWQQYQQYQGHQLQQQQYHQQAPSQQNFTPHMTQNRQGSKSDYEESPQASK